MSERSILWTTGGAGDGAAAYTMADLINWLRRTMISDNFAAQGPLAGYNGELAATAGAGKVSVATGAAYVYGYPYENDAVADVAIPTPVGATRIDRIVLRADWAAQTVRIIRIAGSEGGAAPALTQTPGTTYDVPLAQVSITTGGVITVTDERTFAHFASRVATENLDDGAVTAAKITGGAVGTSMLADGAVTDAKVNAVAAIAQSKISNAIRTIDADMVDGAHAGTGASNVLLLDGSGNAKPSGYTESAGMRCHRTPVAGNRHIESGSAMSSGGAGVTVTFADSFAATPVVVITAINALGCWPALDVTPATTGFIFSVRDQNGNRVNGVSVNWIAEGPD